jgi:hypothetical protein
MTLRRCPACKNQVAAESTVCPVCGQNPSTYRAKTLVKLLLAVGLGIWAVERFVVRHVASTNQHDTTTSVQRGT